MSLLTLTVALGVAVPPAASPDPGGDLLAIRVGRAETVSKGVIEHAVILVEGGKIVMIGEDLPIERGIPVLDRPEWTAIPGLVNAYSRLGLDSEGGDDMSPDVRASQEVYPAADELKEVVKYGVTTLGLYPAGNGVPGQAAVIKPVGKTREEMLLRDAAYLKVIQRAASSSKKLLRDGFKKADEYAEKEKKAREKWEKDQEAKKKKPAAKPEEKKDAEKKEGEEKKEEGKTEEKPAEKAADKSSEKGASDAYVPPEPDAKTRPFLDLRAGKLRALVSISSSAEYLHALDAIGKEKIGFDLRIVLQRESDIFYVADKKTHDLEVDGIGDRKCRVVIEPVLTIHPGTMRQRSPAMELERAGAKIVFVPRNDSLADHKSWLQQAGEIVAAGLKRDVALRAMTLEPAELLGVEARVGSLDKGKDANLVFLTGDPFQPSTQVKAVMLEGRFVHGEVKP